jgi:opacity protein-like surface antigen
MKNDIRPPVPNRILRASLFAVAFAATALAGATEPAAAQSGGSRVWVTGWAGRFTSIGGFSDQELDAFFRFDDAMAFGGGVHMPVSQGVLVGIEVLYASPTYERFNRDSATAQGQGDAKVASALASLRLAGGSGVLGLYLTGGAGIFAWDVDDPDLDDGWDMDLAFEIGAGVEYAVIPRARLFGEYTYWWVYHQKDDAVRKNTANLNLLRVGARFGL